MEQDRNLLFGVLAVQLGKVSSSQLMRAAGAWAVDPSQSLDAVLLGNGALTQPDHDLIERLVEEAVRAHSGDARATLDTFGGEAKVVQTFGATVRVTDSGIRPAPPEAPASAQGAPGPTDAPQPAEPASDTGVAEVPGRYQLVSEQGRGGYGRVLLVRDQVMARDIAMKELIPPGNDPIASTAPTPSQEVIEAVARFLQEAKITGQLEHPSIVPVYELGHREDGSLYYTMKLVRGQTLNKEFAKRKTFRERLELLPRYLDLCHAIAYAHDRGVIHRDIKPDNVMVGSFGETVVIDWGLAKLKGRADVYAAELKETVRILQTDSASPSSKTLYGTILGTPHYMAPEQARGDIESIDERSDVYALGAVLYILLTGKRPYDGVPLQNVILHRNLPDRVPIHKLAPEAPAELVTICNKALESRQLDRYQNASELAQEIQRFLSGALVQSHQYTLRDQLRRFVRKNKAQVATAGAAIAVLLIVAVVSYVQILQANARERDQRVAAQKAEQLAVEKGRAEAEARAAAEYELYASNLRLAYQSIEENKFDTARALLAACPAAHRNFEWGMLQQLCNTDLLTMRGHVGGVQSIAVSADGAWCASADATGAVKTWDLGTGKQRQSAAVMDTPLSAIAIRNDGKYIAVGGENRKVTVLDAATLQPAYSLEGHTAGINAVAFSPDGRFLATASSDDTARVWDLQSKSQVALLQGHLNDVMAVAWAPNQSYIVTAGLDDVAIVWEASGWNPVHRLLGHKNDLTCVAVSPDSARIVTGGDDGNITLWNAATGEITLTLAIGADINDVAFSADASQLAIAGASPVVQIVDLRDSKTPLYALRGHSGPVSSLAFSRADGTLISGGFDHTVKTWFVPTTLAGPASSPAAQAMQEVIVADPEQRMIAFASMAGACTVYDVMKGDVAARVTSLGTTGLGGRLFGFAPDASYLMFTGEDNRPKLTVLATREQIELQIKGTPFFPGISPDGSTIALSSTSGDLELFDARTGAPANVIAMNRPGSHILPVFSPDSRSVLLLSMDEQKSELELSNAQTGASYWKAEYPGGITDALFAEHDQHVLVAGDAGLRLYGAKDGREVQSPLATITLPISAIAVTPDGSRLVAETTGHTLIFFDTANGRELLRVTRPADPNALPLIHERMRFDRAGEVLRYDSVDCQGFDTLAELTTFPWTEMDLPAGAPLDDALESYKATQRANRMEQLRSRDRMYGWLTREIATSRSTYDSGTKASSQQDPFAGLAPKIFDVSPSQWPMLLQMGRARLKQLRDAHGYRGMETSSDLVVDKSLADFLGRLGFENNDIIVRVNDSASPGYDTFIEALESARRKNATEITICFFRSGTPLIYKYVRTDSPQATTQGAEKP